MTYEVEAVEFMSGIKKTISVNRPALEKGEPGISVKVGGKTYAAYEVLVSGPCIIRHDPDKKRQPRAYVVTKGAVMIPSDPTERLMPDAGNV